MRVSFLAVACLLRVSVTDTALAEDAPAAPPEVQKAPQAEPPTPPSQGAPPPATPPPSEPAPAPPATPPPSEPAPAPPAPAPPANPPPNATAPAHVTLEETPEAPPAGSKPHGAKHKAKVKAPHRPKPHEEKSAPPPASESAPAPAIASASATEDAPEAAPSDGEEPESKSKDDESKSKDDDGEGLFGPFRIGALVGVGLPGILSFGGMIKLTRYFGAGLNISVIPAVRLSYYGQADISYQEYDLYGRLFPFGGNLFVGAGVGYATMNGSFRSSVDTRAYQNLPVPVPNPLSIDSEGSVKTLVLTPMLGIMHTWAAGFTLGLDFGAQIPIAPSKVKFETRLPASVPPQIISQYVEPSDAKVRNTLDTVGRTILPTLNFRIGWLL